MAGIDMAVITLAGIQVLDTVYVFLKFSWTILCKSVHFIPTTGDPTALEFLVPHVTCNWY
jgi:hypothetical protein